MDQYRGLPFSFELNLRVQPIRVKPQRITFTLKVKTDEQLDKLISQSILKPVPHAHWETQLGPIKPDGSVYICPDNKYTINKALSQYAYLEPVDG